MDKYEFNIKVEQIKKLISEGDYVTAMKIADSIDWSRVRNANLLSMIAGVYDKNNEYQEAKDILLLAFERAPVGKRLLYKLTELSVKSGEIEEAEDFYHEFVDLAPDDSRQYLLKYLILKAKGAPADQLVNLLEQFTEGEPDERWLFELAELYDRAGRGAECVRTCDKIMLLFGLGNYSDKAMDLKIKYAPLSRYQMDLMRNMGRREPEEQYPYYEEAEAKPQYEGYESDESYEDEAYGDTGEYNEENSPGYSGETEHYDDYHEEEAAAEPEMPDELGQRYEDEDRAAEEYLRKHEALLQKAPKKPVVYEDSYIDGFEEKLGDEVKKMSAVVTTAEEIESAVTEKTKVLDDSVKEKLRRVIIRDAETLEEVKGGTEDTNAEQALPTEDIHEKAIPAENLPAEEEEKDTEKNTVEPPVAKEVEENTSEAAETLEPVKPSETPEASELSAEAPEEDEVEHYHMMIEAETAEEGLKAAIEELKYIHSEKGIRNSAAKTSAAKLNSRGLSASAVERLKGKDLIIENAGDLSDVLLDSINDIIKTDRSGMIVVFIDTPEKLDGIVERNPELANHFDIVSEDYDDESDESYDEEPEDEEVYDEEPSEDDYDEEGYDDEPYEEDEEEAYTERAPQKGGFSLSSDPSEELDIDEFAKYCCQYASEIDCSITGKSMLALYERIELMEEDSIPLTRENAEALIEEAADRAEKPPIGKRIKGMFNSKYDKNGLLILREEDFIN